MVDKDFKYILKLALRGEEIRIQDCAITILSEEHLHITPVMVSNVAKKYKKQFIVKWRKTLDSVETRIPVYKLFSNEIFIYTTVLGMFKKAMDDYEIEEDVILPDCYATSTTGTHQALVFENLQRQNFRPCDPKVPLEINHVSQVLKAYAQWHGLSFVLKYLYRQDFKTITEDAMNMFSYILEETGHIEVRQKEFIKLRKEVFKNEDKDFLRLINFTPSEIKYALTTMPARQNKYHVITHGNCWIHNFMFSYKDDTTLNPTNVKIIDWQCYGLTSPVFDLSLFIYSCINTRKIESVPELLEIYHHQLENFLKLFSLDVHKIFSFKVLKAHWRKFAHYGLLLSSRSIEFCLANGKITDKNDFVLSEEEYQEFLQRVRNNFFHYVHSIVSLTRDT